MDLQVIKGKTKEARGEFGANKCFVYCVLTDDENRQPQWVEWPPGVALVHDGTVFQTVELPT